jgi:hypothetical protein
VTTASLLILLLQAPGIKAQGSEPRVGEFDYIDHVTKLAGRENRLSVEFVESADHSFANREGRTVVQSHIADWPVSHFPLTDFNLSAKGVRPSRANEDQSVSRMSQTAPVDGVAPWKAGRSKDGCKIGNHCAV